MIKILVLSGLEFLFYGFYSVFCGFSAAEVFSGGQRHRLEPATANTSTDRHRPTPTGIDRQETLTEFYSKAFGLF